MPHRMRTVTYDPSVIDQPNMKLSKIKHFIQSVQAIEEEKSEQSSPAMRSKRFSFQKKGTITQDMLTPDESNQLEPIRSEDNTDFDDESEN